MSTPDRTPTFNLKAVVQETGLKPDTLRAWERRYGLPQPQRTAGGHRLYSERDIEIIKWLIAHQEDGMSISRAVDLWRRLEVDGQDPLQTTEYTTPRATATAVSLPEGEAIAELRQAWITACLAFDREGAEQVLTQAFAVYPLEVVCFELLLEGLSEIGEGWYQGKIIVPQEHFASELAMRRLEALLTATPSPTRPDRILIGCPPEEEHVYSPLLLTLLLRRRGWEVLYLGANIPVVHLEATIARTKPQLVIMSAQQLHTAATLLEVARSLQEQRIPLAYGGMVFNLLPGLRTRIPGYFLGERLEMAPQSVEQVLSSPSVLPSFQAAPEAYLRALAHYREHRSQIEAQVWQAMEPAGMLPEYLTIANTNLARNIIAALTLGDIDFLGADINWVEGLLTNHGLPADALPTFLDAYHQAAQTYLDERGAPIINWLARAAGESSGF